MPDLPMSADPTPSSQPEKLHLNPPPEYEFKLLTALSFFLGRPVTAQALACLSMYLRQSEPRIMAQVKYYANKISKQTGQSIDEYDLLDLIFAHPDQAKDLLQGLDVVHRPEDSNDVFASEA